MKQVILTFLMFAFCKSFFGQSLVRYGNHSISRDEFLHAYQKNNLKSKNSAKAYRDYLDLYIRYRLKVQAAIDGGLDTSKAQVTELQNFKSQIVDQYTNDETSLNLMAREAFVRSQKDLQIAYIFVAAPKNALPEDTAKAWRKIRDAYSELKNGKDFSETALRYSDCLLYTSPSPRDRQKSRMPSSA